MNLLKNLSIKRGSKPSKNEAAKNKVIDDDYEYLERYQGSCKDDRRHGQGVFYYDNGDIYDGEWRKGRKEGFGIYTFADGAKTVGWFYRDDYVGKEPNEELKRKMRKKKTSSSDDAKPLRMNSEATSDLEYHSQDDDEDENNLGLCQEFYKNCQKIGEEFGRDRRS